MKKTKLLILGLIGLLMVLGLFLIGCTNEMCDGNCEYSKNKKDICDPYGKGGHCFGSCKAYQAVNKGYTTDYTYSCDCK